MSTRNLLIGFLIVIILIISLTIGYYLGFKKASLVSISSQSIPTPSKNDLLLNQSANFIGVINNVDYPSRTLKATNDQNQIITLPIAKNVIIYVPIPNTNSASGSSDIQKIITNQKTNLTLEINNGKYQVASIYYLNLNQNTASSSAVTNQ